VETITEGEETVSRYGIRIAAVVGLAVGVAVPVRAVDTVCAAVRMEVMQGVTLERQAFEAHMRINNGLPAMRVEDVGIDVTFTDRSGNTVASTADPDNTNALFFVRVDSMARIAAVDGSGSVAPETSADIYWLIIPSVDAGGQTTEGVRYDVGAALSYRLGGDRYDIEVEPDAIVVKPLPDLALDYFLPEDVYGDDAFTAEIEPPEPFSLGLRVRNTGSGTTRALRIDTGQPRIIDDELGLQVGFTITGTEVNGVRVPNSLQVALGDLAPGASTVARWCMRCTLSGSFTEFDASFIHADELGGELTSLIGAVNTHTLLRDVLVDLPGRDGIRDFLAVDGESYRVYESEGADTAVTYSSATAMLSLQQDDQGRKTWLLDTPSVGGPIYVSKPFDATDRLRLVSVTRSDGKRLDPANTWLSKTRAEPEDPWEYALNVFDYGGGIYTVVSDFEPGSHPPYLGHIGDRTVLIGDAYGLGFLVQASDGDGTVPTLTAEPLPNGAGFSFVTNEPLAEGSFLWDPAPGQEGIHRVRFTASDGEFEDHEEIEIYVIGRPFLRTEDTEAVEVFGKTNQAYVLEFTTNLVDGVWSNLTVVTLPTDEFRERVPVTNRLGNVIFIRAREQDE